MAVVGSALATYDSGTSGDEVCLDAAWGICDESVSSGEYVSSVGSSEYAVYAGASGVL